jgi:hypothetical protein
MHGLMRFHLNDYFVKFATGKISTAEVTTQFQNMVVEMFKETPLHEILHDWVKNGPSYYGWRSIKYFLFEYELDLKRKTRAERDKIDWYEFSKENYSEDYQTIEHIYPQRARDKYWSERFGIFNPTQKRLLRNSLGNLVPLPKPRNSSLGNKSFPEKLGDDVKMTGYKYGSYSEIQVAQQSEWGPNQIAERGVSMLDFLEKRWGLTVGDRTQKLKALGIEFIARVGSATPSRPERS